MADSTETETPATAKTAAAPKKPRAAPAKAAAPRPAKARFARAIAEAKAGTHMLGKEAQERAGTYREKIAGTGNEWLDEAKVMSEQAKERAAEFAVEGKTRASEAITSLSKIVEDNAVALDEKLGPKYGDYARKAATTMQDAAIKLESKDLNELGDDAKQFVSKSPGLAVGLAAAAGFMLARIFRKSDD